MKSVIRRRRVSSIIGYNWANSGGGSTPDPGLVYLQENAKLFYDFTQLVGADGSAITSVEDLGPNNIDASNEAPAETPVLQYSQWGDQMIRTFKAFANSGTTQRNILIANTTGVGQLKTDFEVLWVGANSDDQNRDFFGCSTGTDVFRANITANKIRFEYRYSATTARRFVSETTSTVFTALTNSGLRLFRVKFDFTNDVFKFWIDGVEQPMTSLVDAFNLIDPAKWTNTNKLCIGSYNNSGTISLYNNYHLMKNFTITPILTDAKVINVSNYLMNAGTSV